MVVTMGVMTGADREIVTTFDGPSTTAGATPLTGKYVCVVANPDVVIKPEVVNGGFMCPGVVTKPEVVKGGLAGSGIGRVRLCTCCSLCNKAARRASTSFAKAERLWSEDIGSKLVKSVEKSLKTQINNATLRNNTSLETI